MNHKQRRTLERIFQRPTPSNLRWDDVESLFGALGASITPGAGSRVRVDLNGYTIVLHRPHPQPHLNRPTVRDIEDFLANAGVVP